MCGFVGVAGKGCENIKNIRDALNVISHRGPDDSGVHIDKKNEISLGHVRLSILDISTQASQPMIEKSGRYVIVFNGEIYNYKELYKKYCTDVSWVNERSDTSVLLYLYVTFGEKCLPLLDGMFAFSVYDKLQKKLFLARDRFGEKQLYWMKHNGDFIFASEIKAIKSLVKEKIFTLDNSSISIFHMMGSIPSPYTIYEGIFSLEAGSYISINSAGELYKEKYWRASDYYHECNGGNEDYPIVVEKTQELLIKAVSSRLVSDVPVGLFLSGGIDSSSILAICNSLGVKLDRAICMDFEEKEYSEYALAKKSAEYFKSSVESCVVTESIFSESLDDFFKVMDQPTIDGFNTYFVSMFARDLGVKVWLSGVGGDEVFAGYQLFQRMNRLQLLSIMGQKVVPDRIIELIAPLLWKNLRLSRIAHLFENGSSWIRSYQVNRNVIPYKNVSAFLNKSMRKGFFGTDFDDLYPNIKGSADSESASAIFESTMYMRSQLLRDIDNFSMAHSIEVRAPFLDHSLYEYVQRVSGKYKMNKLQNKPLLLDSLPLKLSNSILNQPKKGFTFPIKNWLHKGLDLSFCDAVLDQSNSDIWDLTMVEKMWGEYKKNNLSWGVMWPFYSFARWREENR